MDLIINENFPGLKKNNNNYVYQGDLITSENIKIELNKSLIVYGSIEAGGSIEAVGSIKGKWIEAEEWIEAGEWIEAYGKKTLFIINVFFEKYKIYFMSDLIKIGCKVYSIKKWSKFTDEEISKMDINFLEWWKKWKKIILDLHKNISDNYYDNREERR